MEEKLIPVELRTIKIVVAESKLTGDVNGDGIVNVSDLLAVIEAWGPCSFSCPEDLNGDGVIDVVDLLAVIAAW